MTSTNGDRYVTYKNFLCGLGAAVLIILALAGVTRAVYVGEQTAQDRLADERWRTHQQVEQERATMLESRLQRIEDKLDGLRDSVGA